MSRWFSALLPAAAALAFARAALAAPLPAFPAPEASFYRFVAETDDARSVFLNPAGLAGASGTNLYLDASGGGDRLVDEGTVALQGGSWGFSYRHRELLDRSPGSGVALPEGNLDAYTLATALGPRYARLGVARVWENVDLPGEDVRTWTLGLQSRAARALSIGASIENADRPGRPGGTLAPRYRYGIAVRPLGSDPEGFTLNVEGSHLDGASDRIDMAYGASYLTANGLVFAVAVRDPHGASPEFGASVGMHFGHGAVAARARSVRPGTEDVRGSVAIQLYDEFWRRSTAAGGKVAVLRLEGNYEDTGSGFVLLGGESRGALGVIRRLHDAARDPDVAALAVRIGHVSGGFLGPVTAQAEEMRKGLAGFRAAGKPVVAYLEDVGGPTEMYLASAANEIVMPPLTGVQGIGVAVHLDRLQRMFEKIGVEWDADTVGAYKGTFHTWYTDTTTAAQRREIMGLVDAAYEHLTGTIRDARGISAGDMADIGTGRIVFPDECVSMGLVDTLGWWEDALTAAGRLAGLGGAGRPASMPLPDRSYWSERWTPPPAVAVVPAYGDIVSGESHGDWLRGGRTLGSETLVQQLRAAAGNPEVKAIVLRVDSGGGSVLGSEEMRHEILKVKRERKIPFLVSMAGAAASGGYWISMDADTILADRMTLTGSIGVVWTLPVLEKLYEKAGITSETFKRGEHADMLAWTRHYTPEERAMLDKSLQYLYGEFVRGVAAGRHLSEARVREIGQGRVYFGERAMELGLVDGIGTLADAERVAAARAGIAADYRVLTFGPPSGGIFERVMNGVRAALPGAGVRERMEGMRAELGG